MSIPLDRLYHYIENIAKEIRGDDVIIYRFFPHGSKKIEDLQSESDNFTWVNKRVLPQIYCYDQEVLDYMRYETNTNLSIHEYRLKYDQDMPNNLNIHSNIYDKCILMHSELNSLEVCKYLNGPFIPVYYWSHALIALDWFRYAQHQSQLKKIRKTFLIYNRAWSGTREYRLKFMDLLIEHNLVSNCQVTCNSVDPDMQIHYQQHQYINPQWMPGHCLEEYLEPTIANSWASADFDSVDYDQTEFEVVLETLFDDQRIYLTEKILRPIACGQPFLLLSSAGSLKYLQSYGFKTFSDIIDESYDTIVDAKQRMQAVINTMSTIVSWTESERASNMVKINNIVEYNKQHFFSKKFFNFVTDELKQNLKQGLIELEQTNTSNLYISYRKNLATNETCRKMLVEDNISRTKQDTVHVLKIARTYYNRYLKTLNK